MDEIHDHLARARLRRQTERATTVLRRFSLLRQM